jgi:hypothetical protein
VGCRAGLAGSKLLRRIEAHARASRLRDECDSSVERMVTLMSREEEEQDRNRRASVPGDAQRLLLFCPQLLIEGEDAAGYNELLKRICEGVMPEDPIEELLTADVVFLQWEILRWRRAKWNTMQARVLNALRAFLDRELPFEMCSEYVAEVAEIFQDNLPEDEADTAQTLAQACARREWYAIDKLNEILIDTGRSSDRLDSLDRKAQKPRQERMQELMQGYVQHEPDTVKLVNELLTDAGKSMDDFIAGALAKELDKTERIDRLITLTEDRRNASLREIERRRAALGERLRRSMQQIEHNQLPAIETMPANGKNGA